MQKVNKKKATPKEKRSKIFGGTLDTDNGKLTERQKHLLDYQENLKNEILRAEKFYVEQFQAAYERRENTSFNKIYKEKFENVKSNNFYLKVLKERGIRPIKILK